MRRDLQLRLIGVVVVANSSDDDDGDDEPTLAVVSVADANSAAAAAAAAAAMAVVFISPSFRLKCFAAVRRCLAFDGERTCLPCASCLTIMSLCARYFCELVRYSLSRRSDDCSAASSLAYRSFAAISNALCRATRSMHESRECSASSAIAANRRRFTSLDRATTVASSVSRAIWCWWKLFIATGAARVHAADEAQRRA